MKIWIEIANSPHINMFAHLIRDLEREHDVLLTCRPLANTVDLLNLHGLTYTIVGVHYGGKLCAKILGFPVRVAQLTQFLADLKIDVAISQASFTSPVAARLLGIRCIYMNDNEYALGNIPAFACAGTIMVPEFMRMENFMRYWADQRKVVHYPGVKEGIYLWELAPRLEKVRGRNAGARRAVYIRPEPWLAHYYRGSRSFLAPLLWGLKEHMDVVLLARGKEQASAYEDSRFSGIQVVHTALDIVDIAPNCDLFIGAGGTMTREMAVLGIPTISVYQDELLDVDRYLLQLDAFVHKPELTAREAIAYLDSTSRRPAHRDLLEKGKAAYDMVKSAILNG